MYSDFLFIGHRGTRTDFDENTFTAFSKSIEYGANCIEFDVRKTKDKKLVVLHDSTLDRTTNQKGRLNNFSYKEIRDIKTKNGLSKIPLLSEVLGELKNKTKFMIELKGVSLVTDVLKIVKEKDVICDTIFSGKYLEDLIKIKGKDPSYLTCFNISKGVGLNLEDFMNASNGSRKSFNLDYISLKSKLISKDFIKLCHRKKIKSLSWDFLDYENPLDKIRSLIELGIDGILFDNYKNIPKIRKWLNLP
jgi:glycerophosphoryl diester phosphodiesterase